MAKRFFGKWDRSMKIGDFVTTNFYKGHKIYRIVKKQRRFFSDLDIAGSYKRFAEEKSYKAGDEYNPLLTIEVVFNPNGPVRKEVRSLDISYCQKFSPIEVRKEFARKLNEIKKLTKGKPK